MYLQEAGKNDVKIVDLCLWYNFSSLFFFLFSPKKHQDEIQQHKNKKTYDNKENETTQKKKMK